MLWVSRCDNAYYDVSCPPARDSEPFTTRSNVSVGVEHRQFGVTLRARAADIVLG